MKPEVGKWYWLSNAYELLYAKCVSATCKEGKWLFEMPSGRIFDYPESLLLAEAAPPPQTWWQWAWGIVP